MKNKKYTIIDKYYLAIGLSFLGFRYRQEGYGKGAKYIFEDNEQFRLGLHKFLQLKKELGIFNE